MKKIILFFCFIILIKTGYGQTIPVGSYLESQLRITQLLGINNDLGSFTQRPISPQFTNIKDSSLVKMIAGTNLLGNKSTAEVKLLPISWVNDYNTKLPFGYNNGPLFPSAGYQTMVTGGLFFKTGILNLQLKPEIVYAQNKEFATFTEVQANNKTSLVPTFFEMLNGIDAPERFGVNSLHHVYWGQSKLSIIYKQIELGISTENLWWGPGIQNSIMLSNSAPGFLHWTFNSVRPLKTKIGSFEWQLIGGKLQQSGYLPYDPGKLVNDPGYYIPKPSVSRYISAFTVNWQPKWISGLYIGLSSFDYTDIDSNYRARNIVKRLVPVFVGSSDKANSMQGPGGPGDQQDYAYAANIRQVFPEYKSEIYFEYARNDRAANLRDFVLEPEHSSAYTVGATRLFNLTDRNFLAVKIEYTRLEIPETFLLRAEPSWYVHTASPRDGYTNMGRYVGAGIGPGSNSLIVDVSYRAGINSYGVKFEELSHNNDIWEFANAGAVKTFPKWVDYSGTFYANTRFKQYLLSAEMSPIRDTNYEYLAGNNIFNFHASLMLTYFFN